MDRKTNKQLIAELEAAIEKAGSMQKWANEHGLSRDVVSKSKRANTVFPAVAAALGYQKTEEVWERVHHSGESGAGMKNGPEQLEQMPL